MTPTTIVGRTSLFHEPVHQISVGGEHYGARELARLGLPGPISAMASAPVLQCLECGEHFSAIDLYLESGVEGECVSCAAELQGTDSRRLSA